MTDDAAERERSVSLISSSTSIFSLSLQIQYYAGAAGVIGNINLIIHGCHDSTFLIMLCITAQAAPSQPHDVLSVYAP